MEKTINQELGKALETLALPTKERHPNTKELERLNGLLEKSGWRHLNDPTLKLMQAETVRFLHDMERGADPRWISFCGKSGTGKTMLAKFIRAFVRENFDGGVQQNDRERVSYNKGGFINWGNAINNRMLQGDYEFLDDMQRFFFFGIDDIASEYERQRDLSAAKLYQVLEARLGKWTVITANLTLRQIGDKLDARIASRMLRHGNAVVNVDVPDFNMR